MKKRITYYASILLLFLPLLNYAQEKLKFNEGNAIMVNLSYGYQLPFADMKDRFGGNGVLHLGTEYWTRNNFIFGIEGSFQFGNRVGEDVIRNLRTQEGFIVGNNRNVADIQLRQRGFYTGAFIGRLFSLDPNNSRSGIRVNLGAGLLQHKIRIQDDPSIVVAPLSTEYKKGYDRLSNGLALSQFIGYQLLSNDRRVNFTLGVEVVEGFTQSRRAFNFDTRMADTAMRLDVLLGLRLTWTLPFYLSVEAAEVVY